MSQKQPMDRLAEHLAWLDEHREDSMPDQSLPQQDALSCIKESLDDLEVAIGQAMEAPAEWEYENDSYFQRALSFAEELGNHHLLDEPATQRLLTKDD